jgi:hypothetical protein
MAHKSKKTGIIQQNNWNSWYPTEFIISQMSISDYSLSSPRKGAVARNDKSITYDEEFEKFLNDVLCFYIIVYFL